MVPFWQSFALIFVAEMGDKTQLVSLAFSSRFSPWITLAGVFCATILVHLASVAIGELIGLAVPSFWLNVAAGAAFIWFGLWTLRGDKLDDAKQSNQSHAWGPFFTVTVTFFLAELGDKSMLATITLATTLRQFVPVWLGSTLGMVASDALAILVGTLLGRTLPERTVRYGASAIFMITGIVTIGLAIAR